MRHRIWAAWAPLIAVLLAAPRFADRGVEAASWSLRQAVDLPAFPSVRPSEPVARSLPALKSRSPLVRQWTPSSFALAGSAALEVFTSSLPLGIARPRTVHPAHAARDFPPFPTGPPPE